MRACGFYDVSVPEGFSKLRIYHTEKDGTDTFMLFNEDVARRADTTLTLPVCGDYVIANALTEDYRAAYTEDGNVKIDLMPGESLILIFTSHPTLPAVRKVQQRQELTPHFKLSLYDVRNPEAVRYEGTHNAFFNVTAPDRFPDFSGRMQYTFSFEANDKDAILDLGRVGEVARLTLNGRDAGIRICAPYAFDVSGLLKTGTNTATVTVTNSLVFQHRDRFSTYLAIPPSGLLGEIVLKYLD